jgi:Aminotransferase class-V
MLAPFGVGVLYAKEHLLHDALPFLYGGDMIAEGQVAPERVRYNELPWKYAAGTPNVLGVIVSAQALRLLVDLVSPAGRHRYFATADPLPHTTVVQAMDRVGRHNATDLLQPRGHQPVHRGRSARPARRRVPRRLPLREPGAPRARARSAGQLPGQLLPLQHGRGRRPGR